jgi:uncharacterized membrane protein
MKLKHKLRHLFLGAILLLAPVLAGIFTLLPAQTAYAANPGGSWSYGSVVNGRLTVTCSGSACPEGTSTLYYTGTKWSFAPQGYQATAACSLAAIPLLTIPDASNPGKGTFTGCKNGTGFINSSVTIGNTAAFTKYANSGGAVGGTITAKLTVDYGDAEPDIDTPSISWVLTCVDHLNECNIVPSPAGNTATPNIPKLTDSKVVYTAKSTDQLVKGYTYKICFAGSQLNGSPVCKNVKATSQAQTITLTATGTSKAGNGT